MGNPWKKFSNKSTGPGSTTVAVLVLANAIKKTKTKKVGRAKDPSTHLGYFGQFSDREYGK